MIYDSTKTTDPIRQGDIFHKLPFVKFDLQKLKYLKEDGGVELGEWNESAPDDVRIMVSIQKTYAIVLTQDCDALRTPYISLIIMYAWPKAPQNPKNSMENIINCNTKQHPTLYLPPEAKYNIPKRMIIDFSQIFHLMRSNLETLKNLRLCRLNEESYEHFREKVANYFRRYSYAEYYPLNKEEMDEYESKNSNSGENFIRRQYQV